jgi:hypothetical protein
LPACGAGRAGAKWLVGYSLKTGLLEEALVDAESASELPMWRRVRVYRAAARTTSRRGRPWARPWALGT